MQAAKLWEDWRRLDKVPKSIGQGRYLTGSPLVLYPPVFLPIHPPFLPISLLLTPCGAVCLQSLLLCYRRLDKVPKSIGQGRYLTGSPLVLYPPVFLPIHPPFLPISLLLTPYAAVCLQSLLLCHRRLGWVERTHTDGNGHIRIIHQSLPVDSTGGTGCP